MESELSGIFRVKLVIKNIVRGSSGTQFMHMRVKEEKIPKYINDDIEIFSDSNEESSDEETLLEKIQTKKNSDGENSDEEN